MGLPIQKCFFHRHIILQHYCHHSIPDCSYLSMFLFIQLQCVPCSVPGRVLDLRKWSRGRLASLFLVSFQPGQQEWSFIISLISIFVYFRKYNSGVLNDHLDSQNVFNISGCGFIVRYQRCYLVPLLIYLWQY